MKNVTKTFTITAVPSVMKKIERLMTMIHFSGSSGHSGVLAIQLDGDGKDHVSVAEVDRDMILCADAIASIGYDVEMATDYGFSGLWIGDRKSSYDVIQVAAILKNGGMINIKPSNILKKQNEELDGEERDESQREETD